MNLRNHFLTHVYRSPENDNSGGGGDGSPPPPAADDGKALKETMDGLKGSIDQLVSLASRTPQPQNTPASPPPAPEPDDEPDLAALEGMDRMQYGNYLINRIGKEFNQQFVQPIMGRLSETQRAVAVKNLTEEIGALKAANPDFEDWRQDMIDLSKTQPNLSPKQLLAIVRADNPTKVAELAKKYKPPENNDDPMAPGFKPRKIGFGGLTPSQPGNRGTRPRIDNPHQAALSAWDSTVKELGVEPQLEE